MAASGREITLTIPMRNFPSSSPQSLKLSSGGTSYQLDLDSTCPWQRKSFYALTRDVFAGAPSPKENIHERDGGVARVDDIEGYLLALITKREEESSAQGKGSQKNTEWLPVHGISGYYAKLGGIPLPNGEQIGRIHFFVLKRLGNGVYLGTLSDTSHPIEVKEAVERHLKLPSPFPSATKPSPMDSSSKGESAQKPIQDQMQDKVLERDEKQDITKQLSRLQYKMGQLYLEGVDKDPKKGVKLLKKAFRNGEERAGYALGRLYYIGEEVPQDQKKAEKYFQEAAQKGNGKAGSVLEKFFKSKKIEKAKEKAQVAVENEGTATSSALVVQNRQRDGGEDPEEIGEMTELADLVEFADPNILHSIGAMYMIGLVVPEDLVRARALFEEAARKGHEESAWFAGDMYFQGKGGEVNLDKARVYFLQAAEMGNRESLYNLGVIYLNGYGVSIDLNRSNEFFKRAVEVSEGRDPHAGAAYNLAVMYLKGHGVERSWERFQEYAEIAVEQGHTDAEFLLGRILVAGKAGRENIFSADHIKEVEEEEVKEEVSLEGKREYLRGIELLTRAANKEHVEAQYRVGLAYIQRRAGLSDSETLEKGEEFIKMAVRQRHPKATEVFVKICKIRKQFVAQEEAAQAKGQEGDGGAA